MDQEEVDELNQLRQEFELSGLGDRPQSMSASKIRRLLELESQERMTEVTKTTDKKVEVPERVWIDIREDSGNDYDPGCNAQWMPAGSWKPADDGENESDWALYIRAGTPSNTRQRAERAARRLHDQRLTVVGAWSTPESAIQQVADIIAAEFEK